MPTPKEERAAPYNKLREEFIETFAVKIKPFKKEDKEKAEVLNQFERNRLRMQADWFISKFDTYRQTVREEILALEATKHFSYEDNPISYVRRKDVLALPSLSDKEVMAFEVNPDWKKNLSEVNKEETV